jgi:hypothetical protein
LPLKAGFVYAQVYFKKGSLYFSECKKEPRLHVNTENGKHELTGYKIRPQNTKQKQSEVWMIF